MIRKEKIREFLESGSTGATITKIILASIALGGILFIGAAAPNVIQLLGRFKRARKYSSKQLQKSFFNLKQHSFIEIKTSKRGQSIVSLTKKGERKLFKIDLDDLVIPKLSKWDGKWRVLLFDLPVRFKKAREGLRWKIKDLGFYQLQRSVWIYPYPCTEELLFISEFFGVTKYIEVFTVEELIHQEKLKLHFGLL